ncbi:MAG: putative peptidoglycan binding domain, partial [Pseudomonadota bacterium]
AFPLPAGRAQPSSESTNRYHLRILHRVNSVRRLGMIWELEIGTLADPGLPAGAHARLACLGYECGEPDGELSELLVSALQSFQEEHLGNASGRLDNASRSALRHRYGA